jgi:hypothetical protein
LLPFEFVLFFWLLPCVGATTLGGLVELLLVEFVLFFWLFPWVGATTLPGFVEFVELPVQFTNQGCMHFCSASHHMYPAGPMHPWVSLPPPTGRVLFWGGVTTVPFPGTVLLPWVEFEGPVGAEGEPEELPCPMIVGQSFTVTLCVRPAR